ncbi:MAG: hypothetical protein JWQ27_3186 [Ferruginibacter sp.]|nr:hypothetical protein [Ferruginibacter sp.]
MLPILRRWLSLSFFNLLLVALLGVTLRYKIAFSLPIIEQKFLLNSHSHFAFAGWITQTLILLLVHQLGKISGNNFFPRYKWILAANLFTAYGMLISFIFQGYAFWSICFSTLSLFVSYAFAIYFWKDLNRFARERMSTYWFKAALFFSASSSLGAYSLAFMMATKHVQQDWYLGSIYFFLHFQYNGWFFFAGMGLLTALIEQVTGSRKILLRVFWLFAGACIPAYLLSALWLPFPFAIYLILVAAVIAQLYGWTLMLIFFRKHAALLNPVFSPAGRWLLLLAGIALSIKILLQSGSIHPGLSHLSYGFRPIIIGYLHLVLLAVTSLFLLGYIVNAGFVQPNKTLRGGLVVFVTGIIVNELLLMLQGVMGLDYDVVPYITIFLFCAAIILLTGALFIWVGWLKKNNEETSIPSC